MEGDAASIAKMLSQRHRNTDTDLGLETTLQEVLNLETKNVIELHLILGEDTDAHKATEKGITYNQG